MMKNIMSSFAVTLSDSALIKSRPGQAGRATTELNALTSARLALYNETEDGQKVDQKTLKNIVVIDSLEHALMVKQCIPFFLANKLYISEQNNKLQVR